MNEPNIAVMESELHRLDKQMDHIIRLLEEQQKLNAATERILAVAQKELGYLSELARKHETKFEAVESRVERVEKKVQRAEGGWFTVKTLGAFIVGVVTVGGLILAVMEYAAKHSQ